MSNRRPAPLIGRLAVHLKMITMDQLAEATRVQGRGDSRNLGDILVGLGFLNPQQVATLANAQRQVLAKQQTRQSADDAAAASSEVAPEPPAPAEPEPRPPAAEPIDSGELEAILRSAVERGASDVHVHSGAPLKLRIGGEFVEGGGGPVDDARAEIIVLGALNRTQRGLLEERGELDFSYSVRGLGRFRANVYRQQRGLDGVFRFIPLAPPSLEDLGLPNSLARLTNFHQGMVLLTGPMGCGKSSTLAALVNLINEERREHILTIEDPIEFLHPPKRCLVNQRSVRRHTESFARALRAALREDPDVIVIGELRDLETISLALTAAETGHFVLATLHTNDSIRTVNRLVGAFPSDQQSQVRTMLSESLRAVVSQRLIPRADGQGRVAAFETLMINKAVGNLIRENKAFQIQSILQTGSSQGMQLLDQSIRQHLDAGVIAREEALRHCESPKNLGL